MKTIFIIILVILAGVLFGLIFAKLSIKLINWILGVKIKNRILRGEENKFLFKKKPYSLKEQVEFDLKKKISIFKKIKGLFKKQMKGGISTYGNTGNTGGHIGKQVPTGSEGDSPGEQPTKYTDTNTAQPSREQRDINSNFP